MKSETKQQEERSLQYGDSDSVTFGNADYAAIFSCTDQCPIGLYLNTNGYCVSCGDDCDYCVQGA